MNAIDEPRMVATSVQRPLRLDSIDIHAILKSGSGAAPPRLSRLEQVDDVTPIPEEPAPARRIGRGVFLATVAGGLSALWWGKAAWSSVSGPVSRVADVVAPILPSHGWRIYTVA